MLGFFKLSGGHNMNTEAIKEIMEAFEASTLAKMELEVDDMKLKLEKSVSDKHTAPLVSSMSAMPAVSMDVPKEESKEVRGTWVKAPLVGTYYSARSKDSTPFVEVGQHVKKGDVLCIIEAMKVMNEIHAPKDGVIAEIVVTNEAMVEYDQELIRIGDAL